jgi:hypothetical protein
MRRPHGRDVQLRKAGRVQAHQIERARSLYIQALVIAFYIPAKDPPIQPLHLSSFRYGNKENQVSFSQNQVVIWLRFSKKLVMWSIKEYVERNKTCYVEVWNDWRKHTTLISLSVYLEIEYLLYCICLNRWILRLVLDHFNATIVRVRRLSRRMRNTKPRWKPY